MKRPTLYQILRFVASAAIVSVVILVYSKWLHVNPTTVGFTFLLVVLVVSAVWGLRYAIFAAVLATAGYNYFFLPPLYKFTIADPQNWVALFAFLFTAMVASELSERARREAGESNQRRSEVERLYAFSQQLLVSDNVFGLLNTIPKYIVGCFGVTGAAMLVEAKQETYFFDPIPRDFQGQPHHVTAGRICDLHRGIRIGNFSSVARMFEVIENLTGVHSACPREERDRS